VPLVRGRYFDDRDVKDAPETAIVNIPAGLLEANPDIHIQLGSRRLAVETGWHFGSRYPGDPAKVMVYDFVPDLLLDNRWEWGIPDADAASLRRHIR